MPPEKAKPGQYVPDDPRIRRQQRDAMDHQKGIRDEEAKQWRRKLR